MKERLLDVIKWGLILIIAGVVFYIVYPKYYFSYRGETFRGNMMTGHAEIYTYNDKDGYYWTPLK